MIRILGGEWKGRRLDVPRGVGTRPSSGRLREALFSSLGGQVHGADVHDLFAGSGALGIEALSRGAASVQFVELDPRAVAVIRQNLRGLGLEDDRARVRRGDARRWLQKECDAGAGGSSLRLFLLDPPYESQVVEDLLPLGRRLLESARPTIFVFEHLASVGPIDPGPGNRARTRKHGEGAFTILERDSE